MPTLMGIVWSLMEPVAGLPTDPTAVVRHAIDVYLDERQRDLHVECYPANAPWVAAPGNLVPLCLLAQPPAQLFPAPPGFSVVGGGERQLFSMMASIMHEHIGATAAISPLAREAHTMRVIHDVRYQLNGIVDTVHASALDPAYLIPSARRVVHYPAPIPRITPAAEAAFEQAALGLQSYDVRRVKLRLSLDAAVTVLSCCESLRAIQNVIFALPHWAQAGVYVTEIALRTGSFRRQAQVWPLLNRLPNLRRLSLDAAPRNDAWPRLPASRVQDLVLDLGEREHWTEEKTRRTLAALGHERVRELRFENLGGRPWVAPLYCGDADDRPTLIDFLWNGKGFNAGVLLRSDRMCRLHMLDEHDDRIVFSPLAMSNLTHLTLSNVIRRSALRALFRLSPRELRVLEVILHPGDRAVPGFERLLEYHGQGWRHCHHLRVLRLSAADTGVVSTIPLGPVQLSVAQVRDFMMAAASRTLELQLDDVYVPGWHH